MMEFRYTSDLRVKVHDVNVVYKVFQVLKHEMRFSRGFIDVKMDGDELVVQVFAKDVTSLRSLVSGVLKSLYLVLSVMSHEF